MDVYLGLKGMTCESVYCYASAGAMRVQKPRPEIIHFYTHSFSNFISTSGTVFYGQSTMTMAVWAAVSRLLFFPFIDHLIH